MTFDEFNAELIRLYDDYCLELSFNWRSVHGDLEQLFGVKKRLRRAINGMAWQPEAALTELIDLADRLVSRSDLICKEWRDDISDLRDAAKGLLAECCDPLFAMIDES